MDSTNGKKVLGSKIPYSMSMKDGSPFVFAGLWEGWIDPANDEWLHTCTIIIGEPNEFVRTDPILVCRSSYGKSITMLGYRTKPEKRPGSLPRRPDESVADKSSCK